MDIRLSTLKRLISIGNFKLPKLTVRAVRLKDGRTDPQNKKSLFLEMI